MIRGLVERYHRFEDRYRFLFRIIFPVLALVTGVGTVVLLHRGVDFAPVAAASVLVAWTLAAVLSRFLPNKPDSPRWAKTARWLASGFVAGLYQDALFFLLPVFFGSASWPSVNMITPIVLGAMALFSCFEEIYMTHVLDRPGIRAAFSGIVLFATLCAAIPVLFSLPLKPALAISAAVSVVLGSITAIPLESLKKNKTMARIALAAVLAASMMLLFAPLLPPVPVQRIASVAALGIRDREPVAPSDVFVANLPRIYAHFAIAAPPKFSERVHFRWKHNGETLKKDFVTEISGGRKEGYRTWAYVSNPGPGDWTVELYADTEQLIGRQTFTVETSTRTK
jgi:hypothetical protein